MQQHQALVIIICTIWGFSLILSPSLTLCITLANKKILAYKVRAVLGYIGGAEFENDLIFFRLALVFEIF